MKLRLARSQVSSLTRALGVVSLLVVSLGSTTAQESPGFKMKRLTATALTGHVTLASYRNTVTLSDVVASVGACPGGRSTALGFWSVLGDAVQVPIVLFLDKNESNPADVDLIWTGQAAAFDVYRDTLPVDLVAPGNLLLTTGSCQETDMDASAFDLLFYRVTSATP